jgi:hypothetical protein
VVKGGIESEQPNRACPVFQTIVPCGQHARKATPTLWCGLRWMDDLGLRLGAVCASGQATGLLLGTTLGLRLESHAWLVRFPDDKVQHRRQ